MSKKSNIDSTMSATGVRTYWTVSNGIAGPNQTSTVIAHVEQRKLFRDAASPKSRSEKPYTSVRVQIQWPYGKLFTNFNTSGTRYTVSSGVIGETSFSKGPSCHMGYPYSNPRYLPTVNSWPWNPDLLSQAETKAYLALRNQYKEMDSSSYQEIGIWWGERHETASLLRDTVGALARLVEGVRNLKSGDIRRALRDFGVDIRPRNVLKRIKRELALMRKRLGNSTPGRQQGEVILSRLPLETLKTTNRLVLAYNLGVSPLMRTLDGAYMGLLQSVADPSSLLIKAKGWVIRQDIGSDEVKAARDHVTVKTRVNSLVRYTSVLVCRPSNSDLARLERLGLANPPALLAELTSLSFMLNYFWPILDYLKASGTPMAFEFVDGSYSLKVSHIQDVVYESTSAQGRALARGQYIRNEYVRKVYATFPVVIPPLSLRGDDLNVQQMTNVVTVLIEKVRKACGL